jgi:hypothetical protein
MQGRKAYPWTLSYVRVIRIRMFFPETAKYGRGRKGGKEE